MLNIVSPLSESTSSNSSLRALGRPARPPENHVIQPASLASMIDSYDTLIVDLRSDIGIDEGYIPGAVRLDYNTLIRQSGKAEGLIPDHRELAKVLSSIGLRPWHFVVAYDDETGVEAARLLWSLSAAGHERYAMLNGGYEAWVNAGFEVLDTAAVHTPSSYSLEGFTESVVDKTYVLAALENPDTVIVDTRSYAEFTGEEVRAQRGGHIPGAVHFNWMDTLDLFGDGGLRDAVQLRNSLRVKGVVPGKEVIVYCQSNRRSAHTFVVLKWLGFENVKAYDGSWSEWGNDPTLPVAL